MTCQLSSYESVQDTDQFINTYKTVDVLNNCYGFIFMSVLDFLAS